jgi:predicted membrane protein
MVTSNELSLLAGLLITGVFYWKYRQYEAQIQKEEMVNSFLEQPVSLNN